MGGVAENLIGKQFGRLVVIARAENGPSREVMWECSCSCGTRKVTFVAGLFEKCREFPRIRRFTAPTISGNER